MRARMLIIKPFLVHGWVRNAGNIPWWARDAGDIPWWRAGTVRCYGLRIRAMLATFSGHPMG